MLHPCIPQRVSQRWRSRPRKQSGCGYAGACGGGCVCPGSTHIPDAAFFLQYAAYEPLSCSHQSSVTHFSLIFVSSIKRSLTYKKSLRIPPEAVAGLCRLLYFVLVLITMSLSMALSRLTGGRITELRIVPSVRACMIPRTIPTEKEPIYRRKSTGILPSFCMD